MSRRKGEITKEGIDRQYPHQVSMPVTVLRGSGSEIIHRLLAGMSVCSRHHNYFVHEDDGSRSEHVVLAFSEFDDAQYFAHHLGSAIGEVWHGQKIELISIEERKRREKMQRDWAKTLGLVAMRK